MQAITTIGLDIAKSPTKRGYVGSDSRTCRRLRAKAAWEIDDCQTEGSMSAEIIPFGACRFADTAPKPARKRNYVFERSGAGSALLGIAVRARRGLLPRSTGGRRARAFSRRSFQRRARTEAVKR